MNQHLNGFSFVGVMVILAISFAGSVFVVTTDPFSQSQSREPAATSSPNPASTTESQKIKESEDNQAGEARWKDKLDTNLLRLVQDSTNSPLEPARVNDSGEEIYGVFIATNNAQRLKDEGIGVNSELDGFVTTRLTRDGIIKAAKLNVVSRIESGGQASPHSGGGQLKLHAQ